LSDEALAVVGERHHGRRRPRAFLVHDHGRLTAFHDCHHRIGRPEIDTDDFSSHVMSLE
jgi:NAD-dependent glutamate dehydrogenase